MPMVSPAHFTCDCLARLDALQAELADLAFALERRHRLDAADVTNGIAGRVAEIRAALSVAGEGARRPARSGVGDRNWPNEL